MKKTLFLSAILGAALCSSAFGAVTAWDIADWTGYDETTASVTASGDNVIGIDFTASTWNDLHGSFIVSVKGDSLNETLTLVALASNRNIANTSDSIEAMSLATNNGQTTLVTNTWTSNAPTDVDLAELKKYENLTFVLTRENDGKMSTAIYDSASDFSKAIATVTHNTPQNFNNWKFNGVTIGGTEGTNYSKAADNTDAQSFTITKAGYSLTSVATGRDLYYFYNSITEGKTLTWNGTTESHVWDGATENWTTTEGDEASFACYDNVVFGAGEASKVVSVKGKTVSVTNMTVTDAYTLSSDDNTSRTRLTVANNLSVAGDNARITIGDGVTLLVTNYNGTNVTTKFRELATDSTMLSAVGTTGTGMIGINGNANVDYAGTANTDQTYDFVRSLHVAGNVTLQTNANWGNKGNYATWALKDNKLIVEGDLWLKNRQYMTVGDGTAENSGSLVVGRQVQLGHEQNPADGSYQGHLTVNSDGSAQMSQLYFYGGKNEVLINGTITFTKANGNVLTGNGTNTTDDQANTITFDGATLDASANSWTMTGGKVAGTGANSQKAAITLRGSNTLNIGDGKAITIGGATVDAGTTLNAGTGTGTFTLNGTTTLSGKLTANTAVTFADTVNYTGTASTRTIEPASTENGFAKTQSYATVVTGSGAVTNNAAWTLNGQTATYANKEVFLAAVNNGHYYINTDLNTGVEGDIAVLHMKQSAAVNGQSLEVANYVDVDANAVMTLNNAGISISGQEGIWLHNGSRLNLENGSSVTADNLWINGGSIISISTGSDGAAQLGTTSNDNPDFHKAVVLDGSEIHVGAAGMREYAVKGGKVVVTHDATIKATLSANDDKTDLLVYSGKTATLKGEDLALKNVTMASGSTVTLGSKGSHNHTLALQSLTVNSAAESPTTLNANLNLTKTSTLTLNGALTMGCELNLGDGGIELGGTLLDQALALTEVGDSVTLFNGVDSVTDYTSPWEASTIFSNDALKATDTKNYLVVFNSTDKTVNLTLVPEPATATLSLLALAALAARRRRR